MAPAGWIMSAATPNQCLIAVDTEFKHSGDKSAAIHTTTAQSGKDTFGTLMQRINAEPYLGKRIRLSAHVKSRDLSDWAGLWMRVDGRRHAQAFDNMQPRAIKGTTDWNCYDVVLDVSEESAQISFGVLLIGTGSVWIDDVRVEEVDANVEVTDLVSRAVGARGELRPIEALSDAALAEQRESAKTLPRTVVNPGFEQSRSGQLQSQFRPSRARPWVGRQATRSARPRRGR